MAQKRMKKCPDCSGRKGWETINLGSGCRPKWHNCHSCRMTGKVTPKQYRKLKKKIEEEEGRAATAMILNGW